MLKIPMGRNDGLLTFEETAQQLDVSRRHLGHMMRQGYIRPAKVGRHRSESLFRPEDVNALLELRRHGVDLPKLANVAFQARNLSLSNAAKLEKLCAFLGLENNRLRTDEDSIFLLHMKTQDTLKLQLSDFHAAAVMEWASTFNAFDEAYLQVVEDFTSDQHPWAAYLDLANKMMAYQNTKPETNLRFAYACLDSARRHLRHVSYFYVMTRSGERLANDLFVKEAVDDEIIAQLHPVLTTH
jgi:excisionase family DNA binding protein